ncbi:ABC-type nitrate/sulfonate/bicarbonate transport system, permease component [Micromonospora pattaloongensis]|uniref:ABC-type nitrate/sulfonate/bicarbonate transport system, permease component n=1 Tax=Micromonospora pattaloongensis TaxID=405436 RepID=A0A1H3KMM4_9ACTN|nr:ABC transporter permease [Micromonospora pattaloongensis]SDY53005.1 ABC-type nitrate/sulfonate/bicarbonate transport system, permease component [Micromonospora pattaloongensis]
MTGVVKRVGYAVGLPAVLFAAWWVSTANSDNFYVPPLRTILETFGQLWTLEKLQADVWPSLWRLAVGYAIACLVGVALGVLVGSSRTVRATLEPVLEFFRAVPPPVLVPVIMLFAGIDHTMKIVVIAVGSLWPVLLNTVEGVRAVDEVLSDTCRSYGLTGVARLRHLVLRAASPQIVAGMRQALSIAIILMVISEMTAASNGLGYTIVEAQRSFAIPEMWSGILLLGLLGFLLSMVFRFVENRALAWYHGLRRAQRGS